MKAEFSNVEKLEEWLLNVVQPQKYDLYYAVLDMELYVVKNVSTNPQIHGYVDNVAIEEAGELADNVARRLTTVKSWEWDHETSGYNDR